MKGYEEAQRFYDNMEPEIEEEQVINEDFIDEDDIPEHLKIKFDV